MSLTRLPKEKVTNKIFYLRRASPSGETHHSIRKPLSYSSIMHFLRNTPLYLLSFAALLQSVVGVDPLSHFCSSSENYTAHGPFEINLNLLMGSLSFKAPPTGFGLGSVGKTPDRVNGLAQCRGDVSTKDCETCVVDANVEIRKLCPNNKEAIIWYDFCLLKYSNVEFFGKIDNKYSFSLYNVQNASDPTSFNQKTKELVSSLAEEAYHSPVLFASGELKLNESEKLYGQAQCTRDLSSTDCKKCLDDAISKLPTCCDGKRGGRIVGGSCNFGYELYPFINA